MVTRTDATVPSLPVAAATNKYEDVDVFAADSEGGTSTGTRLVKSRRLT